MSHTMKIQERIIEHRLRGVTNVTENQFGFMPGRSTMETVFLRRQLMERCREQKKYLHMVFIDPEKAYDKVFKNIMWWALQSVINSTCIHLRAKSPNIYMYRKGRIYKEPPREMQ
jgi:hypothetical protein